MSRVHPTRRRQTRGGLLTFPASASPAKKAQLKLAMSPAETDGLFVQQRAREKCFLQLGISQIAAT